MTKPLLSTRYRHALEHVCALFKQHERKFGGIPYVAHLVGVAGIVAQLTDDEDVWIAALHHDTLEDISPARYNATQLEADYGVRVRRIVEVVTLDHASPDKDATRRDYLRKLADGPIEACLVSGADIAYNAPDMHEWLQKEPDLAHKIWMSDGGAERRKWFWGGRYDMLRQRLGADHQLVIAVGEALKKLAIIP